MTLLTAPDARTTGEGRRPARIAMVSEHASPLAVIGGVDAGGQNVHVAALATALGRLGHEVVVHTRRDDPDLPRRVELADNVWVDHIDAGPAAPVPKDELLPLMGPFADQLVAAWADDAPDIVHAHFWMSGLAATAAGRALGVPVVLTYHALGTVKRRYQGDADTSPPSRLRKERRLAADVDCIVATCSDEVRELGLMGAHPERIRVVPCGVDLRSFTADGPTDARTPGLRRIVSIGRLVERKGVADVIAALAHVPDTELVVAGGPPVAGLDGCPEAARLRRLAAEHGVADRVVLRGQVRRPDVPALLRSADAVVAVPWYEPFGIVPLEAMACGTPVVVSSVGGLTDSVVPGVTGLHVPPRDPGALAVALRRVLGDPARARAMGAAGVARTQARYGWDSVAAATAAVYTEVLATARRRAAV